MMTHMLVSLIKTCLGECLVLFKCSSAEMDAHHANLIKGNGETVTDLKVRQVCQGHSHILAQISSLTFR